MDDYRHQRTPTALRIVAAAIITALAACGTAATGGGTPHRDAPQVRHIWEQLAHRQDLRRDVARMPAGWPATEAMRLEAEQPLGDAAQRATWRRNVELMPPEWPATQAMHAELMR
jgi:hypothetical protein